MSFYREGGGNMSVYLIGYDLNKQGKDYTGLINEIKKYGTWWHHLDSTWLIKTNETTMSVFQKLKPHVDENDNLIVIEVTKNFTVWLTEEARKWMNENIS